MIPASFIGAWAGYAFMAYSFQIFFIGWWLSPDSFIASLIIIIIGSITMGAFFLIIGMKVAPNENNTTIMTICAVGIFFCLLFSIIGFNQEDYWAVLNLLIAGATCGIIGWKQINWNKNSPPLAVKA
jgi:Na+-translocating ferredoxin:NAD+ oxidoreductase RnfD subunit